MNKLSQALNKQFEKHRIVFWYDTKKELREDYETLDLPDIEKIEIQNNQFALKYRLLREQPHQKFLLYHQGPAPSIDEIMESLLAELAQNRGGKNQTGALLPHKELQIKDNESGEILEDTHSSRGIDNRARLLQKALHGHAAAIKAEDLLKQMTMTPLDEKINRLFPGVAVRKDLVKIVKGNAIEGRKRVKDQLMRIDSTYTEVTFGYLDTGNRQQLIKTKEQEQFSH